MNIGGSIFPSSCPAILKAMPFKNGSLLVVPDVAADTHRLFYIVGEHRTEVCEHPNGYSCHALASRLILGDAQKVKEQAEYIVRCGGTINQGLQAIQKLEGEQ